MVNMLEQDMNGFKTVLLFIAIGLVLAAAVLGLAHYLDLLPALTQQDPAP